MTKHDDEVIVGDLTRDDFKTAAAAMRSKAHRVRRHVAEIRNGAEAAHRTQTIRDLDDKARKLDAAAAKFEQATS